MRWMICVWNAVCVCESGIWMIACECRWYQAFYLMIAHHRWDWTWSFAAFDAFDHFTRSIKMFAQGKANFTHFANDWIKNRTGKKSPTRSNDKCVFLESTWTGWNCCENERFLFLLFFVSLWIKQKFACFFSLSLLWLLLLSHRCSTLSIKTWHSIDAVQLYYIVKFQNDEWSSVRG